MSITQCGKLNSSSLEGWYSNLGWFFFDVVLNSNWRISLWFLEFLEDNIAEHKNIRINHFQFVWLLGGTFDCNTFRSTHQNIHAFWGMSLSCNWCWNLRFHFQNGHIQNVKNTNIRRTVRTIKFCCYCENLSTNSTGDKAITYLCDD